MIDAIKAWIKSDSAKRVVRTVWQVFGPIIMLIVYDFGMDGAVNLQGYVFGRSGFILIGAAAFALWMNRKMPVEPVELPVEPIE